MAADASRGFDLMGETASVVRCIAREALERRIAALSGIAEHADEDELNLVYRPEGRVARARARRARAVPAVPQRELER